MHLVALTVLAWLVLGIGGALAANSIVSENQKPGTPQSQWDLAGGGSSSIQGFATDISVNHGSTINFKIQANTSNWSIRIYRLGYYQGNGARLVTTINKSAAASQPTPLVDSTTGLVDAGNWTVTASWAVPATAVSGVYIAHLVNNNNPLQENHIPFVVRADEAVSDILFQTSDTTWHAYNAWPCGTTVPSANLYGGSGPGGDNAPGRAYKVSYNRPIATRDSCGIASAPHDFLFGAEFAAIFWLEQNGYDVSYIAGVDTARFPALLLQHKIFTSVGHDEYWDGNARANVEAARDAGINLLFMSGNEVYWKTRWEPSIDGSGTPHRTLVCYKETRHHGPLDPLDSSPTWAWTGTWRDPRFSPPADGGRPENALIGTIFEVDGYREDAIQVPYEMSRLRFWRNTPRVAQTAPGAKTTLTKNILGYEWDASPDNGFRPPGLINLSSTTIDVSQLLLDYGTMTGNGTPTHNLTLYKHPASGALVFGAGTVFWPWGLSDNHDGPPTPTDPDIQQATVNVLADMGAQPSTLQPGLVLAVASTDALPPVSSINSPVNGATFMEGQSVVISGVASDVGGRVAGVEVSVDGGTTLSPATGTTNWTYTWTATPGTHTIRSRATDDSLNSEASANSVTVNVVSAGSSLFGTTSVPSSATANEANSIEVGVKFSASVDGDVRGLRFYKDTINRGPHVASLWGPGGTLLARATFTGETAKGWQTVLFSTPVRISAGTTYTASYHTNGFYSAATNYFTTPVTAGVLTAPVSAGVYRYGSEPSFPSQSYQSGNYWVDVLFAQTPPSNPPVISSPTTANGAVGIEFSYQITATNSPTSFNATGLPPGLSINTTTGLIAGTPTVAQTSNITLSATNALGAGTATLVLNIGAVTDNLFSSNSTPAVVSVNDPNPVELGVKFTSAFAGNVTGIRFYKGPQNTGTHTAHLWDTSGTLLASATFANETASGWQTVFFPTPVAINVGSTYTASYHTNGFYSATSNYFTAPITIGALTTPINAGVYRYGSAPGFPSQSYQASNYWVDVLFLSTPPSSPPVIDSPVTASGTIGTAFSYQITASNSPTSFNATGLPAGLSVNTTTGLISGTPTVVQTSNVTLSATNVVGTANATLALAIGEPPHTLFPTSSAPATVTVNDPNSVELGVKFSSATAGSVTGVRFYKGPQNTGAHTAHLWTASGSLLASATFTNETASGWQTATFASPVAISSSTIYIASYHTNGFYSADGNFFGGTYTNGPLTAPASGASGGNGVYSYGSASSFPSNSYNAANYWVDVMFR